VLLKEIIEYLNPGDGDVVFDATVGGGGHAEEILKRIVPGGKLIASDRDPEAIERARQRLGAFNEVATFVNEDFRNVEEILGRAGVDGIDGAVFDLGISSFQIDEGRKGFSFLREGPLDMRFDPRQALSAKDVVNKFGAEELSDIISKYGEERYAKLLARAICSARKQKKIGTTTELVDIIKKAVGRKYARQRIHPAARTFQAIRIYVNDEINALEKTIKKTITYLRPEGRICVISFHSLEDRIVKNVFRDLARSGEVKLITKRPISPTWEEVKDNPRSRSAKLRVAEKLI